MKSLLSHQQNELRELLENVIKTYGGLMTQPRDQEMRGQLAYWAIELKPKRVKKKSITESHESVIEDAYKEHTGQI